MDHANACTALCSVLGTTTKIFIVVFVIILQISVAAGICAACFYWGKYIITLRDENETGSRFANVLVGIVSIAWAEVWLSGWANVSSMYLWHSETPHLDGWMLVPGFGAIILGTIVLQAYDCVRKTNRVERIITTTASLFLSIVPLIVGIVAFYPGCAQEIIAATQNNNNNLTISALMITAATTLLFTLTAMRSGEILNKALFH